MEYLYRNKYENDEFTSFLIHGIKNSTQNYSVRKYSASFLRFRNNQAENYCIIGGTYNMIWSEQFFNAVSLTQKYGFEELNLSKIYSCICNNEQISEYALKRASFELIYNLSDTERKDV